MFRPVYLYLDIMTFYTLSPFLLTRVQTGVRLSSDFIFLSSCMLLTFGIFSSCFCLFLRQILAVWKRALSKMKPAHVRISSDFCCLLITYANSLEPDHDRRQVRIACALFGYLLMQKVLNSHGQENQFFNDGHK